MPHNTFYTQSGAKLIRFSNLRKIYCNHFLILPYFIYSIRQISHLQNYYISSIPANILTTFFARFLQKLSKTKT